MNPETNTDELHPEKVVSLGTFTFPRGAQSGALGLDWALLTQFLNEDLEPSRYPDHRSPDERE